MAGIPDLTGLLLGTGPATTSNSTGPTDSGSTVFRVPGEEKATGTWMTDGSVQGGNDPGFQQFMRDVALTSFKSTVDDAAKNWNLPEGDIARNPDGSIDYLNTNLGGDRYTYQGYLQELGEGNQGNTLYSMYKKGLTADQVFKADESGSKTSSVITSLNNGGEITPDAQKLIDAGVIKQETSYSPDSGDTKTWKYVGSALVGQPLFSHSSQTGADTGAFAFDPNRGFVTSPTNFHKSTLDKLDNFVPMIVGMLATAGMGAAIGAVGGAAMGAAGGSGAIEGGSALATEAGAGEVGAGSIVGAEATGSGALAGGSFLSPNTLLNIPRYAQSAENFLTKPTAPTPPASSGTKNGATDTTTNTSTPRIPDLTGNILGTQSTPSQTNGIVNSAMGS